MKKLSLITLLFLTTFFASAQEYQIVFDKYWSPYSGASITTSTYNFYINLLMIATCQMAKAKPICHGVLHVLQAIFRLHFRFFIDSTA